VKKSLFVVASLLVLAGMLASACGAARQAPAAASAAAQPTAAPATAASARKITKLTIWHAWTAAEAAAGAAAIKKFQDANPGITVEVLAVPVDQLKNRFTTEASAGGGPDLMVGPKDWIFELAQANLILPLDDLSAQIGLEQLNKAAVKANKYNGKVWALPESTEAIALWYNRDKVKTPPKDSDELLKMARDVGLGLNQGFYQTAGLIFGAGGQLLDSSQKCILDQGKGTVDALNWMVQAKKTPNVIVDSDAGKLDAAFKDGTIGMIFSGSWAASDYAKAMGADKIAVADPIVMRPGGKTFAPFLDTKNIFLSANAKGDAKEAAAKFLKFLSQPDTQSIFVKVGHIPSNPAVKLDDPVAAGLLKQTRSTTYLPNEPEIGAVWTPGAAMIANVLDGRVPAADAPKQACATIDIANKK
jgi:arabinogalactan oligomer / maltooligosaccharide transport system substrate-binding protein